MLKRTWRVWGTAAASLAMLELAVVAKGCGGSSGSPDASVVASVPELDVSGGAATSPGGQGQPGGVVHLIAAGDVTVDTTAPAAPPMVPAVPGGVTTIDAAALAADVNAPGTAVIAGDVASGGGEAIRAIAANGDLFVTGTLRAGDLGGGRQGLDLKATGTLYVTGTVDASGAAGSGQAGGEIKLSANRIVVTGKLLTAGGDGDTSGGAAGAIAIVSMGDVTVSGSIMVRGGAATGTSAGAAQGGAAATLTIDAAGAVELGAAIDARGGVATTKGAGGAVAGGAAGAVRVGEKTPPTTIVIRVPVVAAGGAGDAGGGAGGTFTAEPDTGSINVNGSGAIDVSGGDAAGAPGAGGLVNGTPRSESGGGGFHVAGEIVANGGSIVQGGSGNGADGGRVDVELIPTNGALTVEQSGKITADGGKAGSGVAGGGGHVWLFTMDGDLTIAGTISARGGEATDDGTGGPGGMIYLFSDDNHNAVDVGKGNLLIAPSGLLDASGGDGRIGGSARSDGMIGSVAPFPEEQEKFAIFLNCDGQHGETHNWMDNQGMLIARGGAHNGSGGDITYHGIAPGQIDMPAPDGNHHPPSGNVDMSGDGSGQAGDYGAE